MGAFALNAAAPLLLIVHVYGGWDPTMVFDPKIGVTGVAQEEGAALVSPAEGEETLPYISHANRPAVDAFFEAKGSQCVIVNGLATRAMDEPSALANVLGTEVISEPGRFQDWVGFYGHQTGAELDMSSVRINAPSFPGPYGETSVSLTSDLISSIVADLPEALSLGSAGEDALQTYRQGAMERVLVPVSAGIVTGWDGVLAQTWNKHLLRRPTMKTRLTDALSAISSSSTSTESESSLLRDAKLAIELFRAGASHAAIIGSSMNGSSRPWHTRTDHFSRQAVLYENLFSDLTQILAYATSVNLQDRVVLVVMSEFGRAPTLNEQNGKERWPYTSMLLCGQGLRGGAVVGQTDDSLAGVSINPVFGSSGTPDDTIIDARHVFAALFLKYEISHEGLLPESIQPLATMLGDE